MHHSTSNLKFVKLLNEDLSNQQIWPDKVPGPDVGTYDVHKSTTFVKKKNPGWSMGKGKQIKFTEEYAKNKKYIPGTGAY
jgi:hypothetical protein